MLHLSSKAINKDKTQAVLGGNISVDDMINTQNSTRDTSLPQPNIRGQFGQGNNFPII